jgi:hypothetical protein
VLLCAKYLFVAASRRKSPIPIANCSANNSRDQKFAPSCGDARQPSSTAVCLSSLTVRPRAMSGLSRSWCLLASISLFAISCGRGADRACWRNVEPGHSLTATALQVRERGVAVRCYDDHLRTWAGPGDEGKHTSHQGLAVARRAVRCPIFTPEARRWLWQVSIQNIAPIGYNGLGCLPAANGTTGAQGFFPQLSHHRHGTPRAGPNSLSRPSSIDAFAFNSNLPRRHA